MMSRFIAKAVGYLRPVLLVTVVVVLAGMVVKFGVGNFLRLAVGLSPAWVLLTLATIIANFLFAARRYQMLVAGDLPFLRVLDTIMVSFLLNYASMVQGLGIGAKVGMMKVDGIRASRSIAGIFSEIVFDLLFAVGVGIVFWFVANDPLRVLRDMPPVFTAMMAILLGVAIVIGLVTLRFSSFLQDVVTQLGDIVRSGRLVGVMLTTAGIWIAAGLGFYCMLNALENGSTASLFLCIFAITTGFVTGLVSMIPGGIGVREVTWAYIVSLAGVPLAEAGMVAVLYRILSIAVIVLVLLAWRQLAKLAPVKQV